MILNRTLSTLVLASALAVLAAPWTSRQVLAQETAVLPTAEPLSLHSTVEVSALPAPASNESRLMGRPRLRPDPEALAQWKAELHDLRRAVPMAPNSLDDTAPRESLKSAAASVVSSFEGVINADNRPLTGFTSIPPDTNLGAGPNHLFQMVNSIGRITDKSGGAVSTFSLRSFFQLDPDTDENDPRVIYDAQSGRWFATYAQSTLSPAPSAASSIVLAVSATSDPTGTFCRYRLGNPTSETFFHDFPQLGVSADKVVVSYNAFTFADVFVGAGYYVVNKADLLACTASANVVRSAPNAARFTPFPAQTLDSTSTLFMAMHFDDSSPLVILAINGVPGSSSVTETATTLAIRDWTTPPNAAQPGSAVLLDTGDASVLSAAVQNSSLWFTGNEACKPSGDTKSRSCLRLIEVRTDSTPTVNQDMTLGSSGQYYYYPAVAPDGGDNLHMVFNASSASDFAGLRYTGRLIGDPLNTLQAATELRAGEGAQTRSSGRMGDYSGAAVDPVDPRKVWVSGEYIRSTAQSGWGTFVAELMFPFPPPTLAFGLSRRSAVSTAGLSFRPGDTLQVDLTVSNPGPALVVDAFFGLVLPPASGPALGCPNGDAVAFFVSNLTAFFPTCLSAPLQSFPPLAQSVTFPANVAPATFVNFFSLLWPAVAPAGTYTVFFFLTPPAAFADGFGPDDLTALTTASVDFAP
jgi:hypothetical protein